MQLTRTAEHALRAVLFLAHRQEEGPVTAEAIAEALGAPANYLSKTLNLLAREGIVSSVRGPGGGFTLAERPQTLTIARVVDLFGDSVSTGTCLLGGQQCDVAQPCPAHRRWVAVREAARRPFSTTTIAALLGGAQDVLATTADAVAVAPAR